VTSIGKNAFFEGYGKGYIQSVVSLIENPYEIYGKSSDEKTFSINSYNNTILYVPFGTIEQYKSTKGWKDFSHIVEGSPSGIVKVNSDTLQILGNAGILKMKGLVDNSQIKVYNTNGTLIGSAISHNGTATIDTKLHIGSVVIVNVDEKSFKITIK
jgi:hypothetical protein